MEPKPAHLGPDYAAQFQDDAIVAAYGHRAPYPDAVLDVLESLFPASGRHVLEIGSGTGDLTRRLAPRVASIDAVEPSAAMRDAFCALPGGDHDAIRLIAGDAETAPFDGPYDLTVAAESLHWTDWAVALPRIGRALRRDAVLALLGRERVQPPWWGGLLELIPRFSTNRDFAPYDLVEELTKRDLFAEVGRKQTELVAFAQSVDDYIESFHSRNGFSRDRMTTATAAEFDAELRALVTPFADSGTLTLSVAGTVVWGNVPVG